MADEGTGSLLLASLTGAWLETIYLDEAFRPQGLAMRSDVAVMREATEEELVSAAPPRAAAATTGACAALAAALLLRRRWP